MMKITRLRIENFRSIKFIDIELGETTVFIGPNNAGKTAILEAVRIALTRRWGQRGSGFTEYDVFLATEGSDPKAPPGVSIEIKFEEKTPGEWPEELQRDLEQLAQLDPVTELTSITLRASCVWNAAEACFQPAWEFLNVARQPLVGASARRTNLDRFWRYMPVFYLGALRDAGDEFSSRSQFWGRLLKAMEIPPALESRVQRILDLLNAKLLAADPKLGAVAETLASTTRIAAQDEDGEVNLRLVPLKAWDILARAEIILRNEPDRPWLPLSRHGQGVQSLSVIFLFQAFIEHLLAELYEPGSSPILTLEEPETHLHPQAARALWVHVQALPGQKLITTHSPYFVQHVPLRDIRLVQLTDKGTEVRWLPGSFSERVPYTSALDPIIRAANGLLAYETVSSTLTAHGRLDDDTYRALLTAYGTHPDRAVIHGVLRELCDRSRLFISDTELDDLQTFARRIRGEIFFARRWLLVEGQAEYLLMHALARTLGYDLDEHGVAVIDTKNNGDPVAFAVLARSLGIPWLAVFDGDMAGMQYLQRIGRRDFTAAQIMLRCRTLPAGDLETQLISDGLGPELRSILQKIGYADATTMTTADLALQLDKEKTAYAAELAAIIASDPQIGVRMPEVFREAISALRGLA
jgi:putative ATP-dependent endonuclease of OLD family